MGKSKKMSSYSDKHQEYFWVDPLTNNQADFLMSMDKCEWTFVQGPAGCGKTLLALQTALKAYEMRTIDKIYYVRNEPANNVFGGKVMGALPGDEKEKLVHLLGPIVDNLYELCSPGKAKYILDKGVVEPLTFELLRGRSFVNSFVIVDEAQNATVEGIITAMTRKGRNSKMVFIGDSRQKDTVVMFKDGLSDAFQRLRGLDCVGMVRFGLKDVKRDPNLHSIMERYGYVA